jgi:hypothetical protein
MFLKIAMVICALFAQVLASPAFAAGGAGFISRTDQVTESVQASYPGENETRENVYVSFSHGMSVVPNDGVGANQFEFYFWSISVEELVCNQSCAYVTVSHEYGYGPFTINDLSVELVAAGHTLRMTRGSPAATLTTEERTERRPNGCVTKFNSRGKSHDDFFGVLDGQALQGRYTKQMSRWTSYGLASVCYSDGKG